MSRMIPTTFDDGKTPPGERNVFGWLCEHGPEDWVCLHSLDLAPWNRGRKTEIDFLVLMPKIGMLVIEVKSHDRIAYEDIGWRLGSTADSRGPFRQADDAVATLVRRISDHSPGFSRVPVCRAVMFPCAVFPARDNAEYRAYELFDLLRCHTSLERGTFARELEQVVLDGVRANRALAELPAGGLAREQVDSLLEFLRPVQTRLEIAKTERIARRVRMEHLLREQQKPVLQAALGNPRVIVSGGAGTGKTLIGLEIARQSAEDGRRTGMFCFNRFVGEWMDSSLKPRGPELVAGPFVAKLAEMLGIAADEGGEEEQIAERLANALSDPLNADPVMFDRVIMDEAQDILCRPWLLQCLDRILKGGIAGGSWVLLGDFDHQVLESPEARALMESILGDSQKLGHPTRWKLKENCRNFRVIAKLATSMAGIREELYSAFRRGDGDTTIERPFLYNNDEEQLRKLCEEINYWKNQRNVQDKDIVILSAKSAAEGVANRLGLAIRRRRIGDPGYTIACGTVSDFKGLESEVVIITDIDVSVGQSAEHRRDLFYTGITRATLGVSLLMTPEACDLVTAR